MLAQSRHALTFGATFDGSSANWLLYLRAERCANGPPLLLIPLSALPGLERTMGLIHPYPTPVAPVCHGSRLYMVTEVGWQMRCMKLLRFSCTCTALVGGDNHATDQYDQSGVIWPIGLTCLADLGPVAAAAR